LGLDASLRDSGPRVEIEQPNDRTLVIKSVSMRTKSAAEASGLSEGWTALGLLLGSAEVHAERHLFTRAESVDLVMEVQQTRTGVDKFVIPHGDANSFSMRWTPHRPFDAVPAGAR
jgi:hypothetical protein